VLVAKKHLKALDASSQPYYCGSNNSSVGAAKVRKQKTGVPHSSRFWLEWAAIPPRSSDPPGIFVKQRTYLPAGELILSTLIILIILINTPKPLSQSA
jgi:hypothetical protein